MDVLGAETFTPTQAPSLFLGPTFDWYHIKQKDKLERKARKSEVSHSSVVAGGVVYPQALIRPNLDTEDAQDAELDQGAARRGVDRTRDRRAEWHPSATGGGAMRQTTNRLVCLAVGLLCLLEVSAPDINTRLRTIGLTMLAGMLVFTAQFAIDNYRDRR